MTEQRPAPQPDLTNASEKLLRDFDQWGEAIDYSELSARFWLIEAETRSPLLARIAELEAGLRELVDWCIAGPDDSWPPKLREYRSLLAPAQEDPRV